METIRKDIENENLQSDRKTVAKVTRVQKEIKLNFQRHFDNLYETYKNEYIKNNPGVSIEAIEAMYGYNEFLKKNA